MAKSKTEKIRLKPISLKDILSKTVSSKKPKENKEDEPEEKKKKSKTEEEEKPETAFRDKHQFSERILSSPANFVAPVLAPERNAPMAAESVDDLEQFAQALPSPRQKEEPKGYVQKSSAYSYSASSGSYESSGEANYSQTSEAAISPIMRSDTFTRSPIIARATLSNQTFVRDTGRTTESQESRELETFSNQQEQYRLKRLEEEKERHKRA